MNDQLVPYIPNIDNLIPMWWKIENEFDLGEDIPNDKQIVD